jgi:cytochrome P450
MKEDPFPFFEEARRETPVLEIPERGAYLVTRRADIEYVTLHPELFSSTGRSPMKNYPGQRYKTLPDMTSMDPPEHKVIRAAHMRMLSAHRLRDMKPAMEAEANRLIDRFADEPRVELITAFAKPLPAWVMATLLGVGREMQDQLDVWADEYFQFFDANLHRHGEFESVENQLVGSFIDFMNFCGDLAVERRANPGDDALSELVNTPKPDGSLFTLDELANFIRLLIVGAQTSVTMIAHAVIDAVRMENRGDFADDRHLQRLLDESLRRDGPATFGPRICTKKVELGDVTLPAGTRVLLSWQSGNRDETFFEDPAEFNVERSNLGRHVGFGFGIHRCIGAPLAHAEGVVALRALFSRFRMIRLSQENDYAHRTELTGIRTLKKLHLDLERA